jgi:hypothetical protein
VAGPNVAPQIGGYLLPGSEEIVLGKFVHAAALGRVNCENLVFYGYGAGSQGVIKTIGIGDFFP